MTPATIALAKLGNKARTLPGVKTYDYAFYVEITGGLQANADYKITQPYGTDTVHTDPGATGFFVTQDVGQGAP